MKFYVYEHWRMDREEPFYIGKGKGKRAYNMHSRNKYHLAIQNKVNVEGFAVEVRIVLSGLTEEEAYALERDRIKFWRSMGMDLANFSDGGEGGATGVSRVFTEEHKAKLRKPRTPETIAAVIAGKKKAREARLSAGILPKKINMTQEGLERKRAASKKRIGKKLTEEHKLKLSSALKGRHFSIEHRANLQKPKPLGFGAKISAALSGRPKSEEHKEKLRKPKSPEHVAAAIEGKRKANLARERAE